MNFKKLYAMQKNLDSHIETAHKLEGEDLFDRKVLALLVEIGELANETRCFKFWSIKQPSDKEIILEEFVDGVHFILSLGIECGYSSNTPQFSEQKPVDSVTFQFIEVFSKVADFKADRSEIQYNRLIQAYLQLAQVLGFSELDIEQAYIRKNEVNYERQQNDY